MSVTERPILLMLTDFRGVIPQRIMAWDGYDLHVIKKVLVEAGADVQILGVHDVVFSSLAGRDRIAAIYASSQEPRYKQYLLDVVANLHYAGVYLYPPLEHMMAHEDKAFQAMRLARTQIQAPGNHVFGNRDQAYEFLKKASYPLVGKRPDGFGSEGVMLLKNEKEARRFVKRNMVHWALRKGRPFFVRAFQRLVKPNPVLGLIVFQEFIPELKGDWKLLLWGDKACGLYRENRPSDFRASGSGRIRFVDIPVMILDFARDAIEKLDMPWGSLDIGYDGERCWLLEYQGIHFGLTAAEGATFYYEKVSGQWEKKEGKIAIEAEMANIITRDMVQRGWLGGMSNP